jgi:hypothetical protein
MATVTVSFTLDDQEDHDILVWLSRTEQRRKSSAIRVALRAYVGKEVTLADVYQAVVELDRRLTSGVAMVQTRNLETTNVDDDEPPDVAASLDSLGL